ncbi:hypothetical protein AB0L64_06140 [Kribbella sp. NPDC051936]|uniref:hypothetical protein n=1 Tax=Kribbella sp. NPDC051936 TaxID=3154946 RepID=UPI003414BF18
MADDGQLSEPANEVRVMARGCSYPSAFGHVGQPPIAHVFERGHWTFAQADLGGRSPAVALPMKPNDGVFRHLI